MMSKQLSHFYEFGAFRLDISNRLLLRDGELVPLKPKVIDTLFVFVENSGRVLGKDELLNTLWPDSFVEEGNLTQNIYVLRKALGEAANETRYIETIPKRGYRFAAGVRETTDDGIDSATEHPASEPAVLEQLAGHNALVPKEETQERQQELSTGTPALAPSSSVTPDNHPSSSTRRLYTSGLLVALAAVALAFVWFARKPSQPVISSGVNSIAVLPFKPLTQETGADLIGVGMADALITKLSNVKDFKVLPTSAVLSYTSLDADTLAIARKLGADSVLDGKIQRAGNRVRVTVQLVRTIDGAPLWAKQFDENYSNVFAVQDSISEQVARALTLQLSGAERKQIQKHYTENTEAFQAYLKGRYFWNKRTIEGYTKAVEYFQQAIDHDSNYALAYAGLADCYMRLNESGLPPAEGIIPRAKAAVLKALQLDDTLAEAHATYGFIKFRFDWDFPGAEREYKRALELNPSYAIAHQWYAFYLLALNRQPEAFAQLNRARELDPLSLNISSGFASYYYFTRHYDQAIEQLKSTIEMDGSFAEAHWTLGLAYEQKGLSEQAAKEFGKLQPFSDSNTGIKASLAHLYAITNQTSGAQKVLDELQEASKQRYVSPYDVAVVYAGLGETEHSLAWLEKAYTDQSLRPAWLKFDPRLDNLRADSRFTEFVQRIFPM